MTPVGPWVWLFPATYLIHILEEGFAGERFYVWMRRVIRRSLGPPAFLTLNALFFVAMTTAITALRAGRAPWLLPALGTLTAVNGLGHAAGTIATRHYSPGLLSGMLLWVPLGISALILSLRGLGLGPSLLGMAAGVLASAAVGVVVFTSSRRS